MKKENSSENDDPVARRLDVLIRLLIEQQVSPQKLKKQDYLVVLQSLGLSTNEIGKIFGISSKDASSWLKKAKKQKDDS